MEVSAGAEKLGREGEGGVELERVPLCKVCDIEVEGNAEVLEKGLEMVTAFDGGVSRNRLDMLAREEEKREVEVEAGEKWKSWLRYKDKDMGSLEMDLEKYINRSSSSHVRSTTTYLLKEYD